MIFEHGINIYRKGIGFRYLKIYSPRIEGEYCSEMVSTFEGESFFRPECATLKSSMSNGSEILIRIKCIASKFITFKVGVYEGDITLDGKNIGKLMICDDFGEIALASGSKIRICAKTQEESCRMAFVYHKKFSFIVKYNDKAIIELDNPAANSDKLFGIKIFGFNKIGVVSPELFEIGEKAIIFQAIPLFHFIIYDKYINIDDPPGS